MADLPTNRLRHRRLHPIASSNSAIRTPSKRRVSAPDATARSSGALSSADSAAPPLRRPNRPRQERRPRRPRRRRRPPWAHRRRGRRVRLPLRRLPRLFSLCLRRLSRALRLFQRPLRSRRPCRPTGRLHDRPKGPRTSGRRWPSRSPRSRARAWCSSRATGARARATPSSRSPTSAESRGTSSSPTIGTSLRAMRELPFAAGRSF